MQEIKAKICSWLGLDSSLDDEVGLLQECDVVLKLRSGDKRFGRSSALDQKQIRERLTKMRTIASICTQIEEALCDPVESVNKLRVAVAHLKDLKLPDDVVDLCNISYAKRLIEMDYLADAANHLEELLAKDSSLRTAWLCRAEAFLKMGIPYLADIHLQQPAVRSVESDIRQACAKMMHSERILTARGIVEANVTQLEASKRASLLIHEGFLFSAAIYLLAACAISKSDSILRESMLSLSNVLRNLGHPDRWILAGIRLCEFGARCFPSYSHRFHIEKIKWMYEFEDYEGVMRLAPFFITENIAFDELKVLQASASKRIQAGFKSRRSPIRFATGSTLHSDTIFGGYSPLFTTLPRFEQVHVWLLPYTMSTYKSHLGTNAAQVGCLKRFPSKRELQESNLQIHDLRMWANIVPAIALRNLLTWRVAIEQNNTSFHIIIIQDNLVWLPVDVRDRCNRADLLVAENEECLLLEWSDVLRTSATLLGTKPTADQLGRDLSDVVFGRCDSAMIILSQPVERIERAPIDSDVALDIDIPGRASKQSDVNQLSKPYPRHFIQVGILLISLLCILALFTSTRLGKPRLTPRASDSILNE